MPLLIVGFFVMQLDRGNIANALTGTLRADIGLSQSQVNTSTSLLQAGIVTFQLPFNALLQRVTAPIWLTFMLLLFSLVGLCQALVTTHSSFLATRFLIGACESGYIPGSMYLLSLFYREKELASRTAVFYFGNYLSAATGSLIAAGLLKLGNGSRYAGWQWLFISELPYTHNAAYGPLIASSNTSRRVVDSVRLSSVSPLSTMEPCSHSPCPWPI